ncbi:MAG: hypothetical protein QOF78_4017 [Phycisphaerales bacterium]|jgi:Ca2+-binding RTX toxin-like protein|nr:hypothetical protein [Phycisphaerales bacterium]
MTRSTSRRHRALISACAFIDQLEPRRLLASVGIIGSNLTVIADNTDDVINIAPIPEGKVRVTLNGSSSDHAVSDFTGIIVQAWGGNDRVTISNALTKPSTLYGGTGNDSLVGGGGNDVIEGGTGADTIRGGSGNDTVDYSDRTAPVTVGLGSLADDGEVNEKDNVAIDIETIRGGSGADSLKGAGNNNRIQGHGGNDTLIGLGGNDTLVGGPGTDRLEGGDGTDTGVDTPGDTLVSVENTTGGVAGSAVITSDRTLLVTGTGGADSIHIGANFDVGGAMGNNVYINGEVFTFKQTDFDRLEINALAGNDLVDLDVPEFGRDDGIFPDVLINLADGNDRVELTEYGATINGGNGNDTVYAVDGGGPFEGGAGIDLYEMKSPDGSFIDLSLTPTTENGKINYGTLIGNELANQLETGYGGGTIRGMGGNDTLRGASDALYLDPILLDGGAGNDTLIVSPGGSGEGNLFGGAGNDSLVGGGGDDNLIGGSGADTMRGGPGNDTVDYSARTAPVTVGLGTLSDDGEAGEKDNVATDVETIIGGSGADTLKGHNNNNRIEGRGGNDTLIGLGGNDTLLGGAGSDRLEGGDGNDTGIDTAGDTLISVENTRGGGDETFVVDNDGNVTVNGTDEGDFTIVSKDIAGNGQTVVTFNGVTRRFDADATITVFGRGAQDRFTANRETKVVFHGEDGNDQFTIDESVNSTLFGGAGDDLFIYQEFASLRPQHDGGAGIDMVDYTNQHDAVLDLRNGVNMENGSVGNSQNTIIGTDGDNVLFASDSFATAFTLQGLGGNDTLYGSDEADSLDGGAGDDLLYGRGGNDILDGQGGNDTLRGGDGNDSLLGGAGSDQLEGDTGNDTLRGGDNNDRLFGGTGNDELFGDAGDDLLYGQFGADTLDGGDGTNDRGFDDGEDTLTNIEVVLT